MSHRRQYCSNGILLSYFSPSTELTVKDSGEKLQKKLFFVDSLTESIVDRNGMAFRSLKTSSVQLMITGLRHLQIDQPEGSLAVRKDP